MRCRGYPPLAPARGGHIFRPAEVNRRRVVAERRDPFAAARRRLPCARRTRAAPPRARLRPRAGGAPSAPRSWRRVTTMGSMVSAIPPSAFGDPGGIAEAGRPFERGPRDIEAGGRRMPAHVGVVVGGGIGLGGRQVAAQDRARPPPGRSAARIHRGRAAPSAPSRDWPGSRGRRHAPPRPIAARRRRSATSKVIRDIA